MIKRTIIVFCFCTGIFCLAQEEKTGSGALLPLDKFMEAISVEKFTSDIAGEAAQLLPAEKREEFVRNFMKEVDIDEIEQILKKEFKRTYTDEELDALAEMCDTPAGRSALQKYLKSMQNVMAGIQGEIMRTRKKVLSAAEKEAK